MASTFGAERRCGLLILALAAALSGCSSSKGAHPATDAGSAADSGTDTDSGTSGVTPAPEGQPYPTLDQWHLFVDAVKQEPNEGVIPYDVLAQLFADYAAKYRFLYVPKGEKIGYSEKDTWRFPVGTILVKTFAYLADARDPSKGQRLLETRLFVHESGGWVPHTYVWNDAQTEATRTTGGTAIDSTFIDSSGTTRTNGYVVPSLSDCRSCHGKLGQTDTLGGRTLQLDRDHDYGNGPENQIDHLAKLGLFDVAPAPADQRVHLVDPFGTAPIDQRVRSYLMGNCAHCHQPGTSQATSSGFWLDYASTDPAESPLYVGICKQPTSAGGATCGRQFDVVPGHPEQSILMCRLESTLAKVRMPPLGRNLVHAEGVALVRDWISGLSGRCGAESPPVDAGAGPPSPDAGADASTGSVEAGAGDAGH